MCNRLPIKGQLTIPKAVRDHLGLHEGDSAVDFEIHADGSVLLKKAVSFLPKSDMCARKTHGSRTARFVSFLEGCPA